MPANIRFSSIKVRSLKKSAKESTKGKVKVGFIVGPKNCDPILQGTQAKDWPEELKVKNNTDGWGGQYHVDVQMALKLKRLHPDVFAIDVIPGNQITAARLARNHLNFNIGYDLINASMSQDARHEALVRNAFQSPKSRLWPEWDVQDWIYRKDRYLTSCKKAGIAIIDMIVLKNGIVPADVLKKVKAKGWDRFFIKPAYLGSFGLAGGKFSTKECTEDPSILQKFQDHEAPGYKLFLVQPYTLKPNGQVFDEVRNFFIDGEWAYGVYTDGTDDDKVHYVKEGSYLETTRKLATKAYEELKKVAKWRGEKFVPPITRVDVGVIPDPARGPKAIKVFINEIEMEAATWLVRYCPFDLVSRMAQVYPKKILELLTRLGKTGERVPDAEAMQKLRSIVGGEPAAGALPQPAKAGKKRSADEASQPDARHRAAARVAGA
mmetsp:Transcript_55799/g.155566  ORF Transcript_55799/g.155566 Transcript_55799/m.155566 type:complete len:435 (-) Transcript_55799:95-1399(-)